LNVRRRENALKAIVHDAWASAICFLLWSGGSLGCASYQGSAVTVDHTLPAQKPGWIWVSGVPETLQRDDKDCGAASVSAVLAYWGHPVLPEQIRRAVGVGPGDGLRAGELTTFARHVGFDAYVFKGEVNDLRAELSNGHPLIVGVAKRYGRDLLSHYEVVVGYHPAAELVLTLDPARGWRQNSLSGFMAEWDPTGRIVVVLFPASAAR
jgi:ABC-type bacteriocin/lantibiotic exporter with double-glycine peptidase domain